MSQFYKRNKLRFQINNNQQQSKINAVDGMIDVTFNGDFSRIMIKADMIDDFGIFE